MLHFSFCHQGPNIFYKTILTFNIFCLFGEKKRMAAASKLQQRTLSVSSTATGLKKSSIPRPNKARLHWANMPLPQSTKVTATTSHPTSTSTWTRIPITWTSVRANARGPRWVNSCATSSVSLLLSRRIPPSTRTIRLSSKKVISLSLALFDPSNSRVFSLFFSYDEELAISRRWAFQRSVVHFLSSQVRLSHGRHVHDCENSEQKVHDVEDVSRRCT